MKRANCGQMSRKRNEPVLLRMPYLGVVVNLSHIVSQVDTAFLKRILEPKLDWFYVGDGRSAGHDTMDGGKRRFWLRMATETAIYRSHVPI